MVMPQLGDRVRTYSYGQFPPRHIEGEIIKVNSLTVTVRWLTIDAPGHRPGRTYWFKGRTREVPETSRKAHHNLELIERKGGPW